MSIIKAIQERVNKFATGIIKVRELHPNNYMVTYNDKHTNKPQKILLQVDMQAELVHVYEIVTETVLNNTKLCTVDVIKAHVNVWDLEVNMDGSIRKIGNGDKIQYVFSEVKTEL